MSTQSMFISLAEVGPVSSHGSLGFIVNGKYGHFGNGNRQQSSRPDWTNIPVFPLIRKISL